MNKYQYANGAERDSGNANILLKTRDGAFVTT
jgi:hypothetical protein